MSQTFNLIVIVLCALLLLVLLIYYGKQLKVEKLVDLKLIGGLGLVFFLLGLGIQALNMSEIYDNICCGPDAEEIVQQVKQALVYRYAYNFLAVISLVVLVVLKIWFSIDNQ